MNLNFKKEDLIFQKEVRKFINDNLEDLSIGCDLIESTVLSVEILL